VKWLKLALIALVVVLAFATLAFVVWGETPPPPMPEAIAALQSDAQVQVTRQPWIVFEPATVTPTTGLIFYPGGRVDARSYAPLARAIAEQGYLVAIVPMPLNFAILGANKAADVIKAYPEIEHWAIGGHSLGGVMAASFAKGHPDQTPGLVLLASYPNGPDNLSNLPLSVASIYGTKDGVLTAGKIDASRAQLPADTEFVPISGGNHGQFGWYGNQSGDNPATVSREEQQKQTVAATVAVLQSLR
jgi:hypothetical protein